MEDKKEMRPTSPHCNF